jgi:micrococcal nuclease
MTTYMYNLMSAPIVHDGDTVTVTVDLGFELYHVLHIRMAGINSPELPTDAGKAARIALLTFVASHSPMGWMARTYKSGHEKYGRWLAVLYAPDGTDVNSWMIDNGYAVVMKG